MRTIYLDSDFKCHLSDDGSMTAIQTEFFDDKCDIYIEGHRFIPAGEIWTREDGEVFCNSIDVVTPWREWRELDSAQAQYECDLSDRAELEAAYNYLLNGGAV